MKLIKLTLMLCVALSSLCSCSHDDDELSWEDREFLSVYHDVDLDPIWIEYFDITIVCDGETFNSDQCEIAENNLLTPEFYRRQEFYSEKTLKSDKRLDQDVLYGKSAVQLVVSAYPKPESEWPKWDLSDGLIFSYEAGLKVDGRLNGDIVFEEFEAKETTGIIKGEELEKFLKSSHRRFIDFRYDFTKPMCCVFSDGLFFDNRI